MNKEVNWERVHGLTTLYVTVFGVRPAGQDRVVIVRLKNVTATGAKRKPQKAISGVDNDESDKLAERVVMENV